MAKPYRRKDSRFWWIAPVINGRQVPQSTKTEDHEEARANLNSLEGKVADGIPITPRTNCSSLRELADDLKTDYRTRKRRTLPDLERRLDNHITPNLGHFMAHRISSATIGDYIRIRQEEGAANATINRELSAISRAFTLAQRSGKVLTRPHIEKLIEDNEREGLFTEEQFRAVLAKADTLTRDILILAYYTGWRRSSLTEPTWDRVDFRSGILHGRQMKNRKRVGFPFAEFPEVTGMLERRHEETRKLQKKTGQIIPWVFHRNGQRVRSWRGAWEAARTKAGLPGKLIHDFRRTAVTNMLDAGIPVDVIMDIVGFKTVQMVMRYAQTRQRRLREAGAMLRERLSGKTSTTFRTTFGSGESEE